MSITKNGVAGGYKLPRLWRVSCFFGYHSPEFNWETHKQCWYCGKHQLIYSQTTTGTTGGIYYIERVL